MRRLIRVLTTLVTVAWAIPAFPQEQTIAFVNVNLISMDRESVEPGQTVVIQANRIVAIGTARPPAAATTIDGTGLYLVPGLTDSHVHLTTDMPWAPARPDFGDAPLYLAHGVTTVVNLRGTQAQLEWRRRIEAGELLGPTIYTSGDFVNEPRVNTPEEVALEVRSQAQAGYDLIKFHEVWSAGEGYLTRRGLPQESYARVFEAARSHGLAVIGHVPVNLGLQGLLATHHGAVAHVGELSRLYFLPGLNVLLVTAGTFALLLLIVLAWGAGALRRRWRSAQSNPSGLVRAQALSAGGLGLFLVVSFSLAAVLPGGWLHRHDGWRLWSTLLSMVFAAVVWQLTLAATKVWREPSVSFRSRSAVALATAASIVLVLLTAVFWVRYAWRNSTSGIAGVAAQLRDAGISVQSTLVVYETAFERDAVAQRVFGDPSFASLLPETQSRWRQMAGVGPPGGRLAILLEPPRYPEFTRTIAGTLHRQGVRLIAGTDAMGLPMTIPGHSLLRELELLRQSGLTPYEVIQTATINAARFLGKEKEFGTVAVGQRADLILLEGNPLENLSAFERPVGVMARGRWLPREQLDQALSALR